MEFWDKDDDDDGSWWVAPEPDDDADGEEDTSSEQASKPKDLKSILKNKSQLVKSVGGMNLKGEKARANEKARNSLDCWNSAAMKNEAARKESEKMTAGQKPLAMSNVFKTKAMLLKNANNMSDSKTKKASNETNPWMKPTKKAMENDHETLQDEREKRKMEVEQVFFFKLFESSYITFLVPKNGSMQTKATCFLLFTSFLLPEDPAREEY